jgi:hypothetical protein
MSDSLDHGGKDRWSVFDCQEKDQAYGQIASTLVAGKGERNWRDSRDWGYSSYGFFKARRIETYAVQQFEVRLGLVVWVGAGEYCLRAGVTLGCRKWTFTPPSYWEKKKAVDRDVPFPNRR